MLSENSSEEKYMRRCLQLASLGNGMAAPNPMVGAMLVYNDRIIGEGYHHEFGKEHAEVNCINSVSAGDELFISQSTLFVNLEPCVHFGKTPPCTDLIIQKKVPRVVIGSADIFAEVNGKGIEKLQQHNAQVTTGILDNDCYELNKRFFTFHKKKRPYIILKWAQTADGFIAHTDKIPLKISNEYTDRLAHRWRSEEPAIMVGANTAIYDNPCLTNRLWSGKQPVRILLDSSLRVPANSKLFDNNARTIIFNSVKEKTENNIKHVRLDANKKILSQVVNYLHQMEIQSVLVEGGAQLLQSFIDENYWDEARVITSNNYLQQGIKAPVLNESEAIKSFILEGDGICFYRNK